MTMRSLTSDSSRRLSPAPRAAIGCGAVAILALAATSAMPAAAATVAHPDQLKFRPLAYQPPNAADYRVKLAGGVVAYLVPDHSLPLVTINVLMRIGPDLDPPGKEGLAAMTMNLLTRSGTTARSAKDLEDRVAFLGAQLESGLGGAFGGNPFIPQLLGGSESSASVNLLSKDLDEGLSILVECLQSPGWEAERVTLRREQLLQDMKQRNDDSAPIEQREWSVLMRGEGHWSNRWSTGPSIESITAEDLAAFHHRYVGPKNFVLSVSGDFDRAELTRKLEKAFSGWRQAGERPAPPPGPAGPSTPGWYLVDKDVNQARVSIGLTTIDRYDPEWAAAQVMNDILGGGGFTSRLVNRIRSDEGLAYSVRSALEGGTYYKDPWRASFQTKVRSTAFAIQIALAEVNRIRDSLVAGEELDTSKNKFIEAFPTRFETASAIATVFANDELTGRYGRDPRFYAEYRERIRAVTADDVRRAARRLLEPAKMTVLVVGNASDVLLGDGQHDVTLVSLAGQDPRRLPLRDPLTMKPMTNP
jgi:predicted Zn-dependent peptidase